jgi:hypothetical protein
LAYSLFWVTGSPNYGFGGPLRKRHLKMRKICWSWWRFVSS